MDIMKNTPVFKDLFVQLKQMAAEGATQKELVAAFLDTTPAGSRRLPYGAAWEVLHARGVITPQTRRVKASDGRKWPDGAVPFVPPEVTSWREECDAAVQKAIEDGWLTISSVDALDLKALRASCATDEEAIEALCGIEISPSIGKLKYEYARIILEEEHLITRRSDNQVSEE
jgi:hypothetical protein